MRTSTAMIAAFLALIATSADAAELCSSVPSACEYSGPLAPVFDGDACWSPDTELVAKGTAPCADGSRAFHVEHGEVVDPQKGVMIAYVPLDDACAPPLSMCIDGAVPEGSLAQAVCCEFGVCVPAALVPCNSYNSYLIWCDQGATNADGTVDCFSGEYIP